MPELPEVETTKRGIAPFIIGKTIQHVIVRQRQFRWRIAPDFEDCLQGASIETVSRRAKYLLMATQKGTLLVHLGMSGSLRLVSQAECATKHDHVDIIFDTKTILRFHDQRRFGALIWSYDDVHLHPLLKNLGVEPLSDAFTGAYLFQLGRHRNLPVKTFLMTGQIVVGIGNIYANESLFKAGLSPIRHTCDLTLTDYEKLSESVKTVLMDAIRQGGTTLRDFVNAQGKVGYFQQKLHVYGRDGLPCTQCGSKLEKIRISNRATVFCPKCQR